MANRFAFFNRDGGRGGGRRPFRSGPPVPDPPPPPPGQPVGASFPVGQEPMPITQRELRQNVVCT